MASRESEVVVAPLGRKECTCSVRVQGSKMMMTMRRYCLYPVKDYDDVEVWVEEHQTKLEQ